MTPFKKEAIDTSVACTRVPFCCEATPTGLCWQIMLSIERAGGKRMRLSFGALYIGVCPVNEITSS